MHIVIMSYDSYSIGDAMSRKKILSTQQMKNLTEAFKRNTRAVIQAAAAIQVQAFRRKTNARQFHTNFWN